MAKRVAASVIGAVTPLLMVFLSITAMHLLAGAEPEESWAFHAVWIMAFFGYVACLLLGAVLATLRRPEAIWKRFGLAVCAALLFGLFAWIVSVAA